MSAGLLERRGRGRPSCYSREIVVWIIELHRQGLSYERISVVLNDGGVPMSGGGSRWLKSSVDRLLHTRYAMEISEEITTG